MKNFSIYKFERDGIISTCEFIASNRLDASLPISTPFTFPFLENKVVLAYDKNNWWNPLGGHLEGSESWQEAVAREAEEEGGVGVKDLVLVGYIKVTKNGQLENSKYPPVSILPVTHSRVTRIIGSWQPMETSQRQLFSKKEALKVLAERNDAAQMLEIFEYIIALKATESFTYEFDYRPDVILPGMPITQVYIFCTDEQKRFCIVRDTDEKHYSLPGGGVELGESSEVAARRELMEESQIVCGELMLLGTNIVSCFSGTQLVEQIQQVRYLATAIEIPEFIKNFQGFETEERLFVTFAELPTFVTWLNEPLPQIMLEQIVEKI